MEAEYDITLSFQKKGLNNKRLNFTTTRTVSSTETQARTTAKGAATKLQNLEGAEEKDEKKIAFARESKEKAVAALVEAAIAYRDAADAAGVTVDVEEAPKKAAEEPAKPAEEPAKPADEPEKSDEGAEE